MASKAILKFCKEIGQGHSDCHENEKRLVKMQNRELMFRVIAYNMHRLTVFML